MANPLYSQMMGGQAPIQQQPPQINVQDAMGQLQANPAAMIRQAGYNVPDEAAGNPQAAVMHLIQTGQVGGPMMRMIQPMLNRLMGRK